MFGWCLREGKALASVNPWRACFDFVFPLDSYSSMRKGRSWSFLFLTLQMIGHRGQLVNQTLWLSRYTERMICIDGDVCLYVDLPYAALGFSPCSCAAFVSLVTCLSISHLSKKSHAHLPFPCGFVIAVVSKFIKDKTEALQKKQNVRSTKIEIAVTVSSDRLVDGMRCAPLDEGLAQRLGSSKALAESLVLHEHVFHVDRNRASVVELRQWIVKAALGQDCPRAFHFPAVDQVISKAWIDASEAMDSLGKAYVSWSDAVEELNSFRGEKLDDASEILMRAMRHREAEGSVLLMLANASAPTAADMLYWDPAWLIELVRRLSDHNLVDVREEKQGTVLQALRTYVERQNHAMGQETLAMGPLRDMHRCGEQEVCARALRRTAFVLLSGERTTSRGLWLCMHDSLLLRVSHVIRLAVLAPWTILDLVDWFRCRCHEGALKSQTVSSLCPLHCSSCSPS